MMVLNRAVNYMVDCKVDLDTAELVDKRKVEYMAVDLEELVDTIRISVDTPVAVH